MTFSYIPALAFPSLVSSVWLTLTPQQLFVQAEPQIASKNKLDQLRQSELRAALTLGGMILAAQFSEMCFLKYNIQNGFESKERESQLVETT